ncbi:MAG: hypothetical protein Q9224_000518 [Gallowayella concinna]
MESDDGTGHSQMGPSEAPKSERSTLFFPLIFMIQLGRNIVYCMLIMVDVSLHLGSSDAPGEAAGHFQPPKPIKYVLGESTFGKIMLIVAGRKRAEYNRHTNRARMVLAHFNNMTDRLPTTFIMCVKGRTGKTQHAAALDTGANQNLISYQKVLDLGLPMVSYDGGVLDVIGRFIRPIGWVTIEWCVSNLETEWYEAKFAVLEASLCDQFQILLSAEEIEKRGFFMRNPLVLFMQAKSKQKHKGV